MKQYLFLFLLPLLFVSCNEPDAALPNKALVGRWKLVAQLDSAGAWQPLPSQEPVLIEFRADGFVDYVNAAGQPQRSCCQPTRYTVQLPEPCPINASCLRVALFVNFTDAVTCPIVKCTFPPDWTVDTISDTYLDVYAVQPGQPTSELRYERVKNG